MAVADNFLARKPRDAGLSGMNLRISSLHCLATAACLLCGCGEGLGTTLGAATGDGGLPSETDDPPTLGIYGRPCDVLGNTQWPYASFSPTGDTVALTAGSSGQVELHATSDGHLVAGFDANLGPVVAMAFSPKDNVLATTGVDGSVKLWRDGVMVAEQQVFPRPVDYLLWSHDGASLAVVSQAGPLALLRVNGNQLTAGWSLDGSYHGGLPLFSPDDTVLTVSDGTPSSLQQVLSVADGTQTASGPLMSDSYVMAQSPDGSVIAYTDNFFRQVTIAREGKLLWQRGFFAAQKTGVAFTADGKRVALWGGSESSPVSLYDVDNGNLVGTLAWANNSTRGITFSPDGRWAFVFDSKDEGGAARLVDLNAGTSLALAIQPGRSESFAGPVSVSADGTVMASQSWLGGDSFNTAIEIWNLGTRQHVSQIAWSFAPRAEPALSARGDLVYGLELTPDGDNTAHLSGLRFESLLDATWSTTLPANGFSEAVALAGDGRTLAGARYVSESWRVSVMDWTTGATKTDFSIGQRPTTKLVFSPDGTQIAVVRTDMYAIGKKDFSVWRVSDGQMLFEAGDHKNYPRGVSFSPDGAYLILFGDGGADYAGLEVYDARRWTWVRTLERSFNPRAAVHFSPDGRHLVVPCYDGIHVWRTSDWQRYETFATTVFGDAVFMPPSPNQDVLEISTGVVWCAL